MSVKTRQLVRLEVSHLWEILGVGEAGRWVEEGWLSIGQVYLLVFLPLPAGSRPDREMGLLRWVGLDVQ